ncbi:hypothetical protein MJ561_15780 [Klebsiella pneumoniae]|nr:hypothetical protein MJ561_15780 [Klebsiella pneumoniae]
MRSPCGPSKREETQSGGDQFAGRPALRAAEQAVYVAMLHHRRRTVTLSAIRPTVARSWVMNRSSDPAAAVAAAAGRVNLRLNGDERRSRFVKDQYRRLEDQRSGTATRWRWPPESSCGVRDSSRGPGHPGGNALHTLATSPR